MIRLELNAEKRDIFRKKLDKVRSGGLLPANVYGPKVKSTSVSVPLADFKKVFKEAGESTVVDLKLDGKVVKVLVQDIAFNPISREPIHVDFYAALMDKPIEAMIPLDFVGTSPAVKGLGGMLVKVRHEIEVESLPDSLPHGLEVDLSSLINLGDNINASQITLPDNVKLITKEDEVIIIVEAPKEEKEVEDEEKTIENIEVEKKGKKEEEEIKEEQK